MQKAVDGAVVTCCPYQQVMTTPLPASCKYQVHDTRPHLLLTAAPDGSIVSGSMDTTLRHWDVQTGECLHVMLGHVKVSLAQPPPCLTAPSQSVTALLELRDGRIASSSLDHTIRCRVMYILFICCRVLLRAVNQAVGPCPRSGAACDGRPRTQRSHLVLARILICAVLMVWLWQPAPARRWTSSEWRCLPHSPTVARCWPILVLSVSSPAVLCLALLFTAADSVTAASTVNNSVP